MWYSFQNIQWFTKFNINKLIRRNWHWINSIKFERYLRWMEGYFFFNNGGLNILFSSSYMKTWDIKFLKNFDSSSIRSLFKETFTNLNWMSWGLFYFFILHNFIFMRSNGEQRKFQGDVRCTLPMLFTNLFSLLAKFFVQSGPNFTWESNNISGISYPRRNG